MLTLKIYPEGLRSISLIEWNKMSQQNQNQSIDEFHSDYISTVVRHAQEMSQQHDRQLSTLDLCTGAGHITKALLEQLAATEIDFRMSLVDISPHRLYDAWQLMGDLLEKSQLKFLLRDIININNLLELDPNKLVGRGYEIGHENPERFLAYIQIAGLELKGISPFDKETRIVDRSIDLLVGHGPFAPLYEVHKENQDNVVQRAVDATTRLLRKGGYAVFTTGFNELEEIREKRTWRDKIMRRKPLVRALGVRQAELHEHFQANGLVLQEDPREYTIGSPGPFLHAEVFVYKKG